MKPRTFILLIAAIFVGALAALAVAGVYVKQQVNQSASASALGRLGSLLS